MDSLYQPDGTRSMNVLQRFREAWLRVTPTSHVLEYAGDCPHCQERTTWAVRILEGYARCQSCGHNPLHRSDAVPTEQQDPATPRPESQVPA